MAPIRQAPPLALIKVVSVSLEFYLPNKCINLYCKFKNRAFNEGIHYYYIFHANFEKSLLNNIKIKRSIIDIY